MASGPKIRTVVIQYPEFSNKQVQETEVFLWDFLKKLGAGETISTATVTASVISGTDNSPQNIVSGNEVISGSKVKQLITGGVANVVYKLNCAITTSASNSFQIDTKLKVVANG